MVCLVHSHNHFEQPWKDRFHQFFHKDKVFRVQNCALLWVSRTNVKYHKFPNSMWELCELNTSILFFFQPVFTLFHFCMRHPSIFPLTYFQMLVWRRCRKRSIVDESTKNSPDTSTQRFLSSCKTNISFYVYHNIQVFRTILDSLHFCCHFSNLSKLDRTSQYNQLCLRTNS